LNESSEQAVLELPITVVADPVRSPAELYAGIV